MNARQGREEGGEVSYTEETYDSLFHVHPLSHDRNLNLPTPQKPYYIHCAQFNFIHSSRGDQRKAGEVSATKIS